MCPLSWFVPRILGIILASNVIRVIATTKYHVLRGRCESLIRRYAHDRYQGYSYLSLNNIKVTRDASLREYERFIH
jgi:hypothetical protein